MSSEIFRFAVVRPAQPVSLSATPGSTILLRDEGSELVTRLRDARRAGDREAMRRLAAEHVVSASYVGRIANLDPALQRLLAHVRELDSALFPASFADAVHEAFGSDPREVAASPAFAGISRRLTDSIVASAIDGRASASVRGLLIDAISTLQLIADAAAQRPVKKPRRGDITLVLPHDLLPLPAPGAELRTQRKKDVARAKAARAQRGARNVKLMEDLDAHHAAIAELMSAYERASSAEPLATAPAGAVARTAATATGGFVLGRAEVDRLAPTVVATLRGLDIFRQELNIATAITTLDRSASRIADQLYGAASAGARMVKVGDHLVPEGALVDPVFEASDQPTRLPGVCPPPIVEDAVASHLPFPLSHQHQVRVLGIADLLMVEQSLKRYELSEIAHIENVLRSEIRERKHRVTKTVEESVTAETEETETNEKDLSTSDRFELQTESQNVINESTSLAAGITVTASYGVVDTTANFNATSSESTSNSQRAASNFARDTTSRAVAKIERRKLERRFRRSVEETEEVNRHQFDNRTPNDITGTYRSIDKIYSAQIVNYGKRLMLEFMVPEPAAFLRHVLGNRPVDGITVASPEPPGYCTNGGKTFAPLQAVDIDRYNYLHWASKYGVKDIDPPPPYTLIVSSSLTSSLKEMEHAGNDDDNNESYFNTKSVSIEIPDGYSPVTADVVIDAMLNVEPQPGSPATIHVLIDNKLLTGGTNRVTFTPGTWKNVAVAANTFNKALYAVVLNLFCRLSVEKEQQWKLKTFNAIMAAYDDQKSRYDTAVATAKLQGSYQSGQGSNPFLNRETEKTELKKHCIALLTGQRFESFDGTIGRVGPYGYPEIDFEEAGEEGRVIAFFEQGLEWANMTYLFYPYFWGRKSEWLLTSQLTADDPLFTRFLQAGAARVNVPVRVGFEQTMLTYLSTSVLWASECNLLSPDIDTNDPPPELSLVAELRSQLNDGFTPGPGTLAATHNQATVIGSGTMFTTADAHRRLNLGGTTYVIQSVDEAHQKLTLRAPFVGATNAEITYALGPKLVGEPWEVRLPTTLVKLGDMAIE